MRIWNKLAIASAVAAALTAATAYGQTASSYDSQTGIRSSTDVKGGNTDDRRVFEAMRSVEQDKKRATEPAIVSPAELLRARAAGEIKMNEGNSPREYTQAHTGEKNRTTQPPAVNAQMVNAQSSQVNAQLQMVNAQAHMNAQPSVIGRPNGAIVRLPDTNGGRILMITEKQRAAEHAKYEANKRRRPAESVSIAGNEQSRSRVSDQSGVSANASAALTAPSRIEITRSDSRTGEHASVASTRAGTSEQINASSAPERVVVVEYPSLSSEDRRARDVISGLR